MSADNWEICPRCVNRAEKALAAKAMKLTELMEKLDADERKLVSTDLGSVNPEDYRTFREDYEFYVNPATARVEVSYSGHCTECELGIDFADEREIPGIDE